MPTFVTDPQNLEPDNGPGLPLPLGESIVAGFEETAIRGPMFSALMLSDVRTANRTGQRITKDEAKRQAAERGFPDLDIPDAGMTDSGLETLLTYAEDRRQGDERLSRASGIGAFGGSVAGSFADPAAAILNFIPVVGGAREASILASASVKAGVAGRVLARAGIGAVEGAVGGAVTAPINALTTTALGGDYTLDDAFAEVATSAIGGAALQPIMGGIGEGVAKIADRSSNTWIKKKFGTDSQEWRAAMEQEKRVGDVLAKDAPTIAERAEVPERVPNEADISRVLEPVKAVESAKTLADAFPTRSVFIEAQAGTDQFAVEVAGAMSAHESAIIKAPEVAEPLIRAADALVQDRTWSYSFDEAIQSGSSARLSPVETRASQAFAELAGQPERMARMVGEYVSEAASGKTPEEAMSIALGRVSGVVGTAEQARIASPLTIDTAESVAMYQAEMGALMDAEKVIGADPRVGLFSPDIVREISEKAARPEGRYDAPEMKELHAEADQLEFRDLDTEAEKMADDAEAELAVIEKAIEEGRRFSKSEPIQDQIEIDGVQRSTKNSDGRPLGRTEEEVRNFWKWFGDSKVVDEAGNPLVVYHGTNADFDFFDKERIGRFDKGFLGEGFYFSKNPNVANKFAVDSYGGHQTGSVYPVYLSARNIADFHSPLPDASIDFLNRRIDNEPHGLAQDIDQFEDMLSLFGLPSSAVSKRIEYGTTAEDALRLVSSKDLTESLKSSGVDGISKWDGHEYVVFDPRQIKSATGNRGTFDPSNPDIRMAVGDGAVMSPVEEVRAQIAERFGEDVVRFGEANGFQLVDDWTDIPGATSSRVLGAADGGKAYIAARQLAAGQGPAIYLHEMGAHIGVRRMLGDAGFADVLARAETLVKQSPELAAILRNVIPSDTPTRFRTEEMLAYMVQRFEEGIGKRADWWPSGAQWAKITDPSVRRAIVEFVRDLVAKVKAWAFENMPSLRSAMTLTEADFHALAVRSLQSTGEAATGARFSKAGDPVKDELEAAREASKKARSVYKKAYDKMAALPGGTDDELIQLAMSVGDVKLTREEATGLVERFRKYGGDIIAAQKEATKQADIDRFRAAKNLIAFHRSVKFIEQFKGKEVEGALARDAGSEYNIPGARISVEGNANKWQALLSNAAEHEFRAAGVLEIAKREEFSLPILKALYDIQTGADLSLSGKVYNAEMLTAAKIMDKYTMKAAQQLKSMGVDVGELKGRMLAQQHDEWALRNFANGSRTGATRSAIVEGIGARKVKMGDPAHKAAWVEFITPLLGPETLDGRPITRQYLEATYDLLAGYKGGSEKSYAYTNGEFKALPRLPGEAARLSDRSRKLPFKDADAWYAYQKRCGNPNILENFFGELRSSAKSLGVIETYGPGGEFTRAAVHDAIGQKLAGVDAGKWNASRKKRDEQWATTSGAIDIPGNEIVANVASSFRHLTTSSVMGGAVLSQFGDFKNIAHWRALRFNRSASGIWTESARHLVDFMRATGKSHEALMSVWLSDLDATMGGMIRQLNEGNTKGFISQMAAKVYDWSGFTWLNKTNKSASIIGISHWMGQEAPRGWNEIEPTTREWLELYNFNADEWDLVRATEQMAIDGRSYFTPEGVESIPDEAINALVSKSGAAVTEDTPKRWREEMRGRIIGLMSDAVDQAMNNPTGRERRVMTGGTSRGTGVGEATRSMWQAKSFAVSQIRRGWGLERHARSTDPRARVQKGSVSHYVAAANYIAALSAAGFLSYTVKGWAYGVAKKGIIEDRTQTEDDRVLYYDLPIVDDRVLFASIAQGGGLGIYGDFLLADKDRFGGGFMQTLAGPSIGKIEDLYRLWTLAKTNGDDSIEKAESERGALGNQLVRTIKGVTPYSNLWWSRHAMDVALWWRMQEAVNPGALDRLERNAQKRGDSFIFTKPTDITRD